MPLPRSYDKTNVLICQAVFGKKGEGKLLVGAIDLSYS